MLPRNDLIVALRECRERLRILLAFSVASNGVLAFFLIRELIK